jgi:hypothetical protein
MIGHRLWEFIDEELILVFEGKRSDGAFVVRRRYPIFISVGEL